MLRLSAFVLLLPSLAAASPLQPWRPHTGGVAAAARPVAFLRVLDLSKLAPADGIAPGVLVLAEKNKRYAVYAPTGGRVNLKIPAGDWRVQFYNPRTGEWGKKTDERADDGGLTLKFPADADWAALLVRD